MKTYNPVNICVFAPEIHDPVSHDFLKGINSGLIKHNAKIDIVSAGGLFSISGEENRNTYLYELILKSKKYDGLIIFAGSLTNFTTVSKAKEFLDFIPKELPSVCLSLEIPGFDFLVVNNYTPIKQMVEHFIREHNKKRFCFIKGPEKHKEAEDRLQGFLDGLLENNIKLNESFIFNGNYSPYSGSEAVKSLLKNNETLPDAIICADDDTALGVYAEFNKNNIDITKENIAISGFDNMDFTRGMEPELTTVDQSLFLQGQAALDMLINKINNKTVEMYSFIPHNIYRASCGCINITNEFGMPDLDSIYDSQIPELNEHKSELKKLFFNFITNSNLDIENKISWYVDLYLDNEYSLVVLSDIITTLTTGVSNKLNKQQLNLLLLISQKINNKIIVSGNNLRTKDKRIYHDTSSELARVIIEIAKCLNFDELNRAINRDYYFIGIKSIMLSFPNTKNDKLKSISNKKFIKDKHINMNRKNYYALYHPIYSKFEKGYGLLEVDAHGFEIAEVITYQISRAIHIIELFTELDLKIEELQNSYNKLKETKDLLIESEQLAKLGGLVASFTHELNNPIGIGVTAVTHLDELVKDLKKRFQDNLLTKSELTNHIENTDNVVKIINNNLTKATLLIKGFKQIAVDQSSEAVRKFELGSYINEVIHSLSPMLKKTEHTINVEIASEILIQSYPGVFSQIITNLIQNSLMHGFENITNGIINISIIYNNNNLVITYSDNGCGADTDTLDNMFESYFSTKIDKGGSGLGMAIIKKLITERLSGNITCSSSPGKGITFKITLPSEMIV